MLSRRLTFHAIGTHWDIQLREEVGDEAWSRLSKLIHQRIKIFDKDYSRFRQDSLVTRMSQQGGSYELPSDGYRLLNFYKRLYIATEGKLTPLIGQAMSDAGYDSDYSFKAKGLPQIPDWDEVISYNHKTVTMQRPALLDFGAAGKGYLVDLVADILNESGVSSYTINAGGDILHRSEASEPIKVGLENPLDTSEVIGITGLLNKSLCASSGSKRKWGGYHHIIDPQLKSSPTHFLATWVIADNTMTADGIATALFFADPKVLRQYFDFTYALLDENMGLHYAKDFTVTVFEAE